MMVALPLVTSAAAVGAGVQELITWEIVVMWVSMQVIQLVQSYVTLRFGKPKQPPEHNQPDNNSNPMDRLQTMLAARMIEEMSNGEEEKDIPA